jgi:hypothetical protein
MKNFLSRNFHLVLLGLATAVGLASTAYLVMQSLSFKDSFASSSTGSSIKESAAIATSTNSLVALEALKNKPLWKPRGDGASPFVSRPYLLKDGKLIDPMLGSAPPLYPPIPNQWLVDHQLDYTDVNILGRDPKGKGFTVLEEFLAGTDPNNLDQFPPLYTKLSFSESDIKKSTYVLEFLGEEENEGHKEYQVRPVLPLPNPARGNRPDTSVRGVGKGETIPGAPFLKVVDYIEKKKTINDTDYDFGELVLQNTLSGELHALTKKNVSREYQKHPIQLVESVTFHYQLAGAPDESVPVERGKTFTLGSLDKKYTENYKLVDFSSEGILLDKGGKTYTVKSSAASATAPNAPLQASPLPLSPH